MTLYLHVCTFICTCIYIYVHTAVCVMYMYTVCWQCLLLPAALDLCGWAETIPPSVALCSPPPTLSDPPPSTGSVALASGMRAGFRWGCSGWELAHTHSQHFVINHIFHVHVRVIYCIALFFRGTKPSQRPLALYGKGEQVQVSR